METTTQSAPPGTLRHAHDALQLLLETGGIPQAQFSERLRAEFGDSVCFENCGGMQFDPDQLLQFILGRQKAVIVDGVVQLQIQNTCMPGGGHSHDDDHGHHH